MRFGSRAYQVVSSLQLDLLYADIAIIASKLTMIKLMSLIVGGIILMAMAAYLLSTATWPEIHWPEVNWAIPALVILVGGAVSTGTGIAIARLY